MNRKISNLIAIKNDAAEKTTASFLHSAIQRQAEDVLEMQDQNRQ